MAARILQLVPQLRHIHLDFLLGPGMRRSKVGQQPHPPPLQASGPVLIVDHTRFLELLVSGPRPNRSLVVPLTDIDEPSLLHSHSHRVYRVAGSAGFGATTDHVVTPSLQLAVWFDTCIVCLDVGARFQLLNPATGFQATGGRISRMKHVGATAHLLIASLVDGLPFLLAE